MQRLHEKCFITKCYRRRFGAKEARTYVMIYTRICEETKNGLIFKIHISNPIPKSHPGCVTGLVY
jgi:hypothetical protein